MSSVDIFPGFPRPADTDEFKGPRPIEILYDLDGTLVDPLFGRMAFGTLKELALRKFSVSRIAQARGEFENSNSQRSRPDVPLTVLEDILARVVMGRRLDPQAPKLLAGVAEIGKEQRALGLRIDQGILSGREPYLHALTYHYLDQQGIRPYLNGSILLNPGIRSAASKVGNAMRRLESGSTLYVVENDVKHAQGVALLQRMYPNQDSRVWVYLLPSLSNHPRLLKHAGVNLEPNIIPVANLDEVGERIHDKAKTKTL